MHNQKPMEKEIMVLIVEDRELQKELIAKHFSKDKITFAQTFKQENREKVTEAIKDIE